MFSNITSNIYILKGAYRKLKSYYYYNKNFLLMRKKITDFEFNPDKMEETFSIMAKVLAETNSDESRKYINNLIDSIDFYVLPKKFQSNVNSEETPVSNTIQRDKKMTAVNFFIDADIEIYIFDTLWTVLAAKMDKDNNLLSYNVYGNTINMSALFPTEEIINFNSRNLFNRYFYKYTAWRNNAFNALEKNYNHHKDSVLLSLDIKSFYYSVAFNFEKLGEYFDDHFYISLIAPLTNILKNAYSVYLSKIVKFRKDLGFLGKNETPLPIGLFSSMLLGNIYLREFDKQIESIKDLSYYGRYVDDILLVFNKTVTSTDTTMNILEKVLVENDILESNGEYYSLKKYPALKIQSDKIKVLYIDHNESKAIIDIYNNTIRIIPSQMDPIPNANLDLQSFDETAYNIDKLTKENKIRDIGFGNIDPFRVGQFFSALPYRYAHINIGGTKLRKEIDSHIDQVKKFFAGSQSIEFHTHWLNYIYFLVITQRNKQLRDFITDTKDRINTLLSDLDKSMYKYARSINKKVKETLLHHLVICLETALSLDIDTVDKHFNHYKYGVIKTINSNMFQHNFVSIPLANYLEYVNPISYCKMDLEDIGQYPKELEKSFKITWSPRFIHYDELLLLLFYNHHKMNRGQNFVYTQEVLIDKYAKVNHINNPPFYIDRVPIFDDYDEYLLERISVPVEDYEIPEKVNIAVGSIEITEQKCADGLDRWKNISFNEKKLFYDILTQSHNCFKPKEKDTSLLVFPEFYFPIYWIRDLIRFARDGQIGIVTGLQYLKDNDNHVYNYLLTILPFKSGKKGYRNAFIHIREKNDYSPIEFLELAKKGLFCKNREIASYQIFHWKGIRMAPIECFELTDVQVRAMLKGRCDLIAAPVFNPDTTYFSNIIDSTVRDIHTFIVQANTSHLGDSRVTGPYDRDNKDIYKMKGGDNDHVVIGTVEFKKLKDFQANYYKEFERSLSKIKTERTKKYPNYPKKNKTKPDIKPLSARFKNK